MQSVNHWVVSNSLFKLTSFTYPNPLPVIPPYFRLSIQDLWKALNDSNPDAVSDFEDFIGEMASEVQTAQNALKYAHTCI